LEKLNLKKARRGIPASFSTTRDTRETRHPAPPPAMQDKEGSWSRVLATPGRRQKRKTEPQKILVFPLLGQALFRGNDWHAFSLSSPRPVLRSQGRSGKAGTQKQLKNITANEECKDPGFTPTRTNTPSHENYGGYARHVGRFATMTSDCHPEETSLEDDEAIQALTMTAGMTPCITFRIFVRSLCSFASPGNACTCI